MPNPGFELKVDKLPEVFKAIDALTKTEILVGVPSEKDPRKGDHFGNAAIAYVQDKGSPAAHIPARQFMEPGIQNVQAEITAQFESAGRLAFTEPNRVEVILNKIGLMASQSIKAKIQEGIPPPLAPSTIKGRIRRVKGKRRREKIAAALEAGTPLSRQGGEAGIFTPLISSGNFLNSIMYVLRKIGKTK